MIENFQVYLQVLNNEILIQGRKEDIKCVKEILNIEKIRAKGPVEFFIYDNDKNEIIFCKDNKKIIRTEAKTSNGLIQFEPKVSTKKDDDCEIIKFVPSSKKIEKSNKINNSVNLNEYAELFNMDFDKNAEKQNKVKRIDKLISAMPDDQKILALNHVNSYQKKNSKRSEINETEPIIFMSKKTLPNDSSNFILPKNVQFDNSNESEIKFQPNQAKIRARSRNERKIDRNYQSKNPALEQNNKHVRSKSSAPTKPNPSRQLRHIIIDGSNIARE